MNRLLLALACAASAMALPAPALSQGNDDDYTPLNSRIKRDRQFPLDLLNRWRNETGSVSRARNRMMLNQFSKCVFNRSREDSHELLRKTDYGFASFEQIGLNNDKALRLYGFKDCLGRVASNNGTGVQLRFSALAHCRLAQLIEQAFDSFVGVGRRSVHA